MRLVRALLLCLLLAPSAAPALACCEPATETCDAPAPCPVGACEVCRPATCGTLSAPVEPAAAPVLDVVPRDPAPVIAPRRPEALPAPAAIPLYLRLHSLRN